MRSPFINPPFPFMASSTILITATILIISCCSFITAVEGVIGINWGRQTTHRLIPSMVVDLLLQNDIRHIKLFSPSDNVLKAFASSGIAVTTTLPNQALVNIKYPLMARYFLQEKVQRYVNQNVNIKYIHVGAEPFSTYARGQTYETAPVALRLIQEAIVANGYNLTATMPHFTDVLTPGVNKPSEADFRPDLKEKMVDIVRLLNQSNAPFAMNMFPIYSLANHTDWDVEFAFIDNKSNFTIRDDNGLIYRNVFEFVYDSFLHALAKAGSPGMQLIVGKIGWPTDGYPGANVTNAERFFRKFLPYIKSNKGTPLRPGISIDVFIHSLADENQNSVSIAAFQRHWGVYRSNGEPKYKIDFSGRGRDIYPTTAKGVILMPKRWCVFNNDTRNLTKVTEQREFACQKYDCTSLAPGGSCSRVDYGKNVSYAFNTFFQSKAQTDQRGASCDFEGLGVLVPQDPSEGTCKFTLEILAAEKPDTDGLNDGGIRISSFPGFSLGSALLFMIFLWGVI